MHISGNAATASFHLMSWAQSHYHLQEDSDVQAILHIDIFETVRSLFDSFLPRCNCDIPQGRGPNQRTAMCPNYPTKQACSVHLL